jgi:DNA-binding NtrC family response regulator
MILLSLVGCAGRVKRSDLAKEHSKQGQSVDRSKSARLSSGITVLSQSRYAYSGAVLVVDDEPEIRKMVSVVLAQAGYTVFLADSGETAKSLFQKHASEITLLLTDVVAPGMSGPMLADQLLECQPHMKVLFMSGYNASMVVRRYVLERGFALLAKPFTAAQLVAAVEETIGPAHRPPHAVQGKT